LSDTSGEELRFVTGILIKEGPARGQRVEVHSDVILGRENADLTIEDFELSRQHARLKPIDGMLEIEDLGSLNGTWVNGARIPGPTRVQAGDLIQIGATVIEVLEGQGETRMETIVGSPGARADEPALVEAEPLMAEPTPPAPEQPHEIADDAGEPNLQPTPVGAAPPPHTAAPAITAVELVREFKNGPRAVDGVSLEVAKGEIYGFLGPNGAGKSTTVKMLVTLLPPSAGTASVGGFDIVRESPRVRRVIGVALQEAAIDPLLTGRELLRLQAGLHGFDRRRAEARSGELLERVGLSGAADRKVGGYSGGMKRRLDLALALVHSPQILFLDEPTTGLDPQSRTALWDEVARLARNEGVTVFLTTQYLEEADVLADRIAIIDRGQLVAEGTPAALKAEIGRPTVEVLPAARDETERVAAVLARFGEAVAASPEVVAVRLESPGALADVVRALDAEQLAISNLTLRAPTLDDVFLAKTGRTLEGVDAESPEEADEQESDAAVAARTTPFGLGGAPATVVDIVGSVRGSTEVRSGVTPVLVATAGPLNGQSIVVDEELVLGREGDVVIEDSEASRRHALVSPEGGAAVVRDLGSLNGTWVNGARITNPVGLAAGDTITIGKSSFEVRFQPMAQPTAGHPDA
jgi:ABC-2 type transport system ATP-binding protein